MTVIKLSKSGKQFQVIDDQGNIYGTSVVAVQNILQGKVKSGHTVCMRMPFKVAPERFGVSPLWDPEGLLQKSTLPEGSITLNNDSFSAASLKKEEVIKKFEDKEVW